MKKHYAWTVGFLVVAFGVILGGAKQGVTRSLNSIHQKVEFAENQALKKFLNDAIGLARKGDLKGAHMLFEAISNKYPNKLVAWLNLGISRGAVGNLDGAEKALLTALKLAPRDYDVLAELANISLDRGQVEKALEIVSDIPVGEGQLDKRLASDLRWIQHSQNYGVRDLYERHNVKIPQGDLSEKAKLQLEDR